MAIIRAARPQHSFTQIRNDVIRDDRLSYRARGVLVVILSHSDGWGTSAEELTRRGAEGRDAIRTALRELEDAGYLVREKRQDGQGRWATHQVIYDTPHLDAEPALFPDVRGFVPPGPGNPPSVNPPSENPPSVSQASIEDHGEDQIEQPSPTGKGGAAPAPAHVIATAVYDHTQGMVNFMAVRQVAGRALKVKGATVERITQAMCQLYDEGRPLMLTTVGQRLSKGGGYKDTHNEHWAKGGEF